MPLVSVIIPNYNHGEFLSQRIRSVLNQTFQNIEVIILDDNSSDNSTEVIEKYKDHPKISEILYNDSNSGTSYKQWYKGIRHAKGELIWIAESDDLCTKRFLASIVPFFQDSKTSVVYCGTSVFESETEIIEDNNQLTHITYDGKDFIRHRLLSGNKIYNASMAVFRKIDYLEIENMGYSKMKLAGDWLLWTQLIMDKQIVAIENKLNYTRKHPENTTNRFRALGFDFIEGMEVYRLSKTYCKNQFNRREVYESWNNYYSIFKNLFLPGIRFKVLKKIFETDQRLFFYIQKKQITRKLKSYIK